MSNMAEKPVYVTVEADRLWLKSHEVIEQVQEFCESHGVNPADCAEFTISLSTPAKVRFTLYDRNAVGQHYLVGGKAAAFMETRILGDVPPFLDQFMGNAG